MKTFMAKEGEVDRRWYLVDAEGKPLGRLAAGIACMLRGKTKPTFTPHVDTGDFVVVVNAEKVKLTGNKDDQKLYRRYTGYRGGLREEPASRVRERHPDRLVKLAVRGMLPKSNLSRRAFRRLKVYAGGEHPHAAQQPEKIELV
jgi:large subunit ribosomal protein L13